MARIPFVAEKDYAPAVAELFGKMAANGAPALNVWKMAAHVPAALPHFIRMGNALLTKTKISPKLRELAILRLAAIVDCEYERVAHLALGREVGITDDQLAALADWQHSSAFDDVERAVLQFTDAVVNNLRVDDEVFAAASRVLDRDMLVELNLAIGFYSMIARMVLAFEVDLDEQAPASATQIMGRQKD